MCENQDYYYSIWQRLEDSFPEIDCAICSGLYLSKNEYKILRQEADELLKDYPIIYEFLEKKGPVRLSAIDHEIIQKYFALMKEINNMERHHIYFNGHTDGFVYLKNIKAL